MQLPAVDTEHRAYLCVAVIRGPGRAPGYSRSLLSATIAQLPVPGELATRRWYAMGDTPWDGRHRSSCRGEGRAGGAARITDLATLAWMRAALFGQPGDVMRAA